MTLTAALENPFVLFEPAFAQRSLLAVLLLALISAAIGWAIVLRDLPFFAHAIGAGAYPVMVFGVIAGISIAVSALVGAVVFALCLGVAAGVGRTRAGSVSDVLTGLAVAAALAIGAVLASRAGSSDTRLAISPEALLFGSLLTIDTETLVLLGTVTALVLMTAWFASDRWLAGGFDPGVAGHLGSSRSDIALLGCVAIGAGASLPMTGSLLTGAMLIIPAATARMLSDRARQLPLLVFAIALSTGLIGLYLSLTFDLPTGAAIAAVAGSGFFAAAGVVALRKTRGPLRTAGSLALITVAAVAIGGCGGGSSSGTAEDGETLNVVATTPQIADIVKQVGGEAVNVTTLLPPDADPHEYEPKPKAVAAIAESGVVFRSGGDLDAWLLPAVKAAAPDSAPVDLSRSAVLLPAGEGHDHGDEDHEESGETHDEVNAHWYLAPDNVARATQRVRDALIKAEPTARDTFRTNATQYLNEIEAVDEKLAACASEIPEDDRRVMAGHNDFAYLAEAFGLKVAAQIAADGESEPSASELQKAVDAARAANVRALIASKGEVSNLDKQVAGKLDVPLLQLYADNLTTGGDASTLLGAIAYDVDRIADAVTSGSVRCPAVKR